MSYQLSVISYQLSVISNWLSVIGYRWMVSWSRNLLAVDFAKGFNWKLVIG